MDVASGKFVFTGWLQVRPSSVEMAQEAWRQVVDRVFVNEAPVPPLAGRLVEPEGPECEARAEEVRCFILRVKREQCALAFPEAA